MADNSHSDLLITKTPGTVTLTLTCGYGQPVTTSVRLKRQDGSIEEIKNFNGNTNDLELGNSEPMKSQILEIHSTIQDIHDNAPGHESVDIDLFEKVQCNDVSVETRFINKTIGKGQFINCFYEVTII
jgi:hypothetical protein